MPSSTRPSGPVAAQRRRAFLWLPMLVAGAMISLAVSPMITIFNSLDVLGLVLTVAGLLGFIREVDNQ